MDVYAVPLGDGRHELYCEVDEPPGFGAGRDDRPGFAAKLVRRFRQTLADAELEPQRPQHEAAGTWTGRLGRWLMRHMAEAIAEQRLLWQLRGLTTATLVHPAELGERRARQLLERVLGRDRDRHLRWLLVDGVLAAITGPLFFFVPGPNLVAYYFVFRAVGHFFAWRGARRGLDRVSWRFDASQALGELGAALDLPPADRAARVAEVEAILGLRHLAAFVGRVSAAS